MSYLGAVSFCHSVFKVLISRLVWILCLWYIVTLHFGGQCCTVHGLIVSFSLLSFFQWYFYIVFIKKKNNCKTKKSGLFQVWYILKEPKLFSGQLLLFFLCRRALLMFVSEWFPTKEDNFQSSSHFILEVNESLISRSSTHYAVYSRVIASRPLHFHEFFLLIDLKKKQGLKIKSKTLCCQLA